MYRIPKNLYLFIRDRESSSQANPGLTWGKLKILFSQGFSLQSREKKKFTQVKFQPLYRRLNSFMIIQSNPFDLSKFVTVYPYDELAHFFNF